MAVISTISSIFDPGGADAPDFGSLTSWESWAQGQFGTTVDDYIAEVVNNFPGGVLLDNLILADWGATNAFNRPIIRPKTPADGHQGVVGDGFILSNSANAHTIDVQEQYTEIHGITVRSTATGIFNPVNGQRVPSDNILCDSLIIESFNEHDGLYLYGEPNTINNCLIIGGPTARYPLHVYDDSTVNNVTIVGSASTAGVRTFNVAQKLTNVVSAVTGGPSYFDATGALVNCASRDASATGTLPQTGVGDADFVNYTGDNSAGSNYSPAPDSQKLVDKGTDPAILTLDIAGNTRNDPDEIGAYAYIPAAPGGTVTFDDLNPVGTLSGTELADFGSQPGDMASRFTTDPAGQTLYYYLQAGTLPAGLSVNELTGEIEGEPADGSAVGSPYEGIVVRGTLTQQNPAVYGRWDAASITYAESVGGGLTVDEYQINTVTDGTSTVKSDIGHTTGVHYFEIVCKGTIANAMVGMSDGSAHNGFPGSSAGSLAYWPKKGEIRESGANIGGQPTIAQTITSVYGVIVDIDAATISWFVDGVAGPQDWSLSLIAAEAGGISNLRPAVGNGSTNDTYEYRINAGQDDFAHPENIPDGCHLGWGLDVPVKVAVFK